MIPPIPKHSELKKCQTSASRFKETWEKDRAKIPFITIEPKRNSESVKELVIKECFEGDDF